MDKEQIKQYVASVLSKLQPHGPITARAMFGGFGIYFDKVMFACIVEGELYFRVDDLNRTDYEKYQAKPFVYDGGRRPVTMPYRTLPQEIFEDPKKLPVWIQKSLQASIRGKLKIKKKAGAKRGTNSSKDV